MELHKLESLIPYPGDEEVKITAYHPTLGRGTITLLPFAAGPEGEDTGWEEDGAPEGMATFLPDTGPDSDSQFLGFITPRDCDCGRCLPFELVNNAGNRNEVKEKIQSLLVVSKGWAIA